MAEQGLVKCMVLQGVGPYLDLHRWLEPRRCDCGTAIDVRLCFNKIYVYIAAQIRALSIPYLAAIHGKLIGGRLALALVTYWRVCAADTIFNVGNLSRGRSHLLM